MTKVLFFELDSGEKEKKAPSLGEGRGMAVDKVLKCVFFFPCDSVERVLEIIFYSS